MTDNYIPRSAMRPASRHDELAEAEPMCARAVWLKRKQSGEMRDQIDNAINLYEVLDNE